MTEGDDRPPNCPYCGHGRHVDVHSRSGKFRCLAHRILFTRENAAKADRQRAESTEKSIRTTILRAAEAAYEANRIYCASHGDMSQPMWADVSDWQWKSVITGVKQIAKDPETTPEESHEGWLRSKKADGWVYGPTKDPEKKTHPCMVPYAELPPQQRGKDALFGIVVRAALGIP